MTFLNCTGKHFLWTILGQMHKKSSPYTSMMSTSSHFPKQISLSHTPLDQKTNLYYFCLLLQQGISKSFHNKGWFCDIKRADQNCKLLKWNYIIHTPNKRKHAIGRRRSHETPTREALHRLQLLAKRGHVTGMCTQSWLCFAKRP